MMGPQAPIAKESKAPSTTLTKAPTIVVTNIMLLFLAALYSVPK